MPKSEIDDIFASKGKAKAIQPVASSSSAAPEIKGQKKKKKSQAEPIDNDAKSTTKKRPAPETVIDPSTQLPSAKRAKIVAAKKQPAKDADQEAKDTFKDSRGSGPRASIGSASFALLTFYRS